MSDETLRQAAFWLVTATDVLDRWDREHGYVVNSERDCLADDAAEAWVVLRAALAADTARPGLDDVHTPDTTDLPNPRLNRWERLHEMSPSDEAAFHFERGDDPIAQADLICAGCMDDWPCSFERGRQARYAALRDSTSPEPDRVEAPRPVYRETLAVEHPCGCTCCSGHLVIDTLTYRCSGNCGCTARLNEDRR